MYVLAYYSLKFIISQIFVIVYSIFPQFSRSFPHGNWGHGWYVEIFFSVNINQYYKIKNLNFIPINLWKTFSFDDILYQKEVKCIAFGIMS